MREANTFTESLRTMRHLEDFVPADHPLRPIRQMVNEALVKIDALFAGMYEADTKGCRPNIAPEKLLRAMLLQVFHSGREERQLMEQTQCNLLFQRFTGLAMDDAVWVPTVNTKNCERPIAHDAVTELFNHVLEVADKQDWLSGEHFSVNGTLIMARAGHKSFVRKDGSDEPGSGASFEGQTRSNEMHESTTDQDAWLYRKGMTGSELRSVGHTIADNRHGLSANAMVTTAGGQAGQEAARAMIHDASQAVGGARAEVTLGADKVDDVQESVDACLEMEVTPHVAQNTSGRRSAAPDAIAKTDGYAVCQKQTKLIGQRFGWAKTAGRIRQVRVRGLERVDQMFVLTMAAHNLTPLRTLGKICLRVQ